MENNKKINHQQSCLLFSQSTQKALKNLLNQDNHQKIKVELSPKEYLLMKFLMTHPEKIFNRQQLLDHVWGHDLYITDRTIDSHVYSLRKKLKDFADYLVSVRGLGYQLTKQMHLSLKTSVVS